MSEPVAKRNIIDRLYERKALDHPSGMLPNETRYLLIEAAREIERLQQRLTGELIHKCFVCEEVDSPRDGCDCVCCTVRRAEVKACRLLLDNTRMRVALASLLDWWNELPNDLKSDPALDPPPTAIKIALKICGTDEK